MAALRDVAEERYLFLFIICFLHHSEFFGMAFAFSSLFTLFAVHCH